MTSIFSIRQQLVNIWKEILGLTIEDFSLNFFAAGGNSIQVFQMIDAINQQWRLELTMDDFFETGNIETLSQKLFSMLNNT